MTCMPIVPWPAEIRPGKGAWTPGDRPRIAAPGAVEEHARLLGSELAVLTGCEPVSVPPADADIVLELGEGFGPEEYSLRVGTDRVRVCAGDLEALARGTGTLLQALEQGADGWRVPVLEVRDRPAFGYRAVMVDCARHFQSPGTLRAVVDLCRLYKVRYLQLHLTDDESFTFPSRAFPVAPTAGRSYSREELIGLDRYAAARGVGIVPEIDVPGHSKALVRAYPRVFGLGHVERNDGLVHPGREAAYDGIRRLLGELCDVFGSSPWIHVGGDEANLDGVGDDPEAMAYMREHGIADVEDLFRHFLTRVHGMVAARGRRTLMWEGFRPGGEVRVPEDVTVLVWDGSYYAPDRLAAAGHPLVNASWQPIYVVGGGRLPPERIYAWHARRWEHFDRSSPAFGGLELPVETPVLGGQMCVWEQREHTTVEDLRPRMPAFAERLWNPGAAGFTHFRQRWPKADARAWRLLDGAFRRGP